MSFGNIEEYQKHICKKVKDYLLTLNTIDSVEIGTDEDQYKRQKNLLIIRKKDGFQVRFDVINTHLKWEHLKLELVSFSHDSKGDYIIVRILFELI